MQDPEPHAAGVIRASRESQGLTQTDLAERVARVTRDWPRPVELHATAVTRIEKGRRHIGLREAVALASALGLTLGELLEHTSADPTVLQNRALADKLLALVKSAGFGIEANSAQADPQVQQQGSP